MSEDNGKGLIGALVKAASPWLRIMPLWAESIGAGAFITAAIEKKPRLKKRLGELDGKVFSFHALDIEKRFNLVITGGAIRVVPHITVEPDVEMRGETAVFLDLFLGRVDPDTVFFTRRLEISGDTAAAIHLKNILADM